MLLPLFAQVLLTFFVGAIMRTRRNRAVNEGTDWRYFKTFEGEKPPRDVLQADQHFVNMFEVPMLFFAAGLAAIVFGVVDEVMLVLASAFVFGRGVHAWISLTNNRLLHRAKVYVLTCLNLLALWAWLVYSTFI